MPKSNLLVCISNKTEASHMVFKELNTGAKKVGSGTTYCRICFFVEKLSMATSNDNQIDKQRPIQDPVKSSRIQEPLWNTSKRGRFQKSIRMHVCGSAKDKQIKYGLQGFRPQVQENISIRVVYCRTNISVENLLMAVFDD